MISQEIWDFLLMFFGVGVIVLMFIIWWWDYKTQKDLYNKGCYNNNDNKEEQSEMPQALIYLSDEEHKKIHDLSKKWKMSMMDTIKRIIRRYENESVGKVKE